MKIIIVLLLIVVLAICIGLLLEQSKFKEDFSSDLLQIKAFRINTKNCYKCDSLKVTSYFYDGSQNIIKLITADNYMQADLLLFESMNFIERQLSNLNIHKNIKFINGFKGTDLLAHKSILGLTVSKKYLPVTYDLQNPKDVGKLKENKNNELYICKKNVQQQSGILITRNVDTSKLNNSYVVCQSLLQNPMLIKSKKINLRIYLLIIIHKRNLEFYIYNDGFIYYAPNDWIPNNDSKDVNITTGILKDRRVYKSAPLTIQDLKAYIGNDKWKILYKNIIDLFKNIKSKYAQILLNENKDINPAIKMFQVFGCDIAPDSSLNVKIMEINKGPSLDYKDLRDKELKVRLMSDMINIVFNNITQNFIKILKN